MNSGTPELSIDYSSWFAVQKWSAKLLLLTIDTIEWELKVTLKVYIGKGEAKNGFRMDSGYLLSQGVRIISRDSESEKIRKKCVCICTRRREREIEKEKERSRKRKRDWSLVDKSDIRLRKCCKDKCYYLIA